MGVGFASECWAKSTIARATIKAQHVITFHDAGDGIVFVCCLFVFCLQFIFANKFEQVRLEAKEVLVVIQ